MFRKILLSALIASACGAASAGAITSASSAVINSGGPGFGSIDDTFNQAGLAIHYVSGVTDFATYIAGNPRHTNEFFGYEWFSEEFSHTASVTYDLGRVLSVAALALWNEEGAGIGNLNLYQSANGIDFTLLAAGLLPTNNPNGDYGADVFSFAAVNTRFIRFDMSGCPQNGGTFDSCSIGEVAFNTAAAAADVPEPTSVLLLGAGLAGIAALRRRRA